MKLLMIIVEDSHKEEVEIFLQQAGVDGYTEIHDATGMGVTGPRLGSGAFPKTSALVFSVVEDGEVVRLKEALLGFCEACGERVKLLAWDVEEIL
jgi:Nitrogen regulatory protein P-II